MPTIKPNEERNEWLDRCIPILIKEGKDSEQATAICHSMYREGQKKSEAGMKPMSVGSFIMPEDGLMLNESFVSLLAQGRKKILVKSKPFRISGSDKLLITRNKAFGIIKVSAPKQINIKQFSDLESEHGITAKKRKAVWPTRKKFWAYKVLSLKVFATSIPIEPITGNKVVVKGVKLKIEKFPTVFELSKVEAEGSEMTETTKTKFPVLMMPNPAFNTQRLKSVDVTGLLSRVERKQRVGEEQVLVNEMGETGSKPFAYGVVKICDGKKFAGIGTLPKDVIAGIDEFTRREFQGERSFWYHQFESVKTYDKPIELVKPISGGRFTSDIDIGEDSVKGKENTTKGVPPELSVFALSDGRPVQIDKDTEIFDAKTGCDFVIAFPGLARPWVIQPLESGNIKKSYAEASDVLQSRGMSVGFFAERVGDLQNGFPVFATKARLDTTAINSSEIDEVLSTSPDDLKELSGKQLHKLYVFFHQFYAITFSETESTSVEGVSREDLINAYIFLLEEMNSRGQAPKPQDELDSEVKDFNPEIFKADPEPVKDEAKAREQDEALSDFPKESGKRDAVFQTHFRGKTLHGDFRIKINGHLVGWTLALQKPGTVKAPIETVQAGKDIISGYDAETGNRYMKPLESPAGVFATPKPRQPLRWLDVADEVFEPGDLGTTRNFPGVWVLVDKPKVEFGRQSGEFHEYFITDSETLNGLLFFRKIDQGGESFWRASLSKTIIPSILKRRTVSEGVMPPDGRSWLPVSLEKDVPNEFKYWNKTGDEAKAMRDALVDERIFTEDSIQIVGGEIRLVKRKSFVVDTFGMEKFVVLDKDLLASRKVFAMVSKKSIQKQSSQQPDTPRTWVYECVVGPISKKDIDSTVSVVKIKGEVYSTIGNTFTTNVKASPGDTLELRFSELLVDLSDDKQSICCFNPVVVGKARREPSTFEEMVALAFEHETKNFVDKIFEKRLPIIKGDKEDERIVYGVVLEPEEIDKQKDIYSEAEVRTAAHRFMEEFRHLGLMHQMRLDGRLRILESYIAPQDLTINGETVKKGSWMLVIRVLDTDLWEAVKSGELTGFSIGGSAVRKPDSDVAA